MPVFYNFTENGLVYSFDDVFVPADLFRDGNLWTWGNNGNGQLGNAQITLTSTPVTTFAGGTNWKQVIANESAGSLLAIKTDGTLWTWGQGSSGELGNAAITDRSTPVTTFAGGTNWKQVSCDLSHAAAIKTDGTLWTWGSGSNGRLGNGVTTGSISTPVTTFAGGTNWKQVDCGLDYTTAIKTDGTLWVWGRNNVGQLGNAAITDRSTPVTTFAGGTNWKQVDCGTSITAAIKTDGTLWSWGSGSTGRLGNGVTTGSISTPVTTFAGGTNWKQVSVGGNIAAIKTDGTLWVWGAASSGQLGNFNALDASTPVTTFAGGTNWKNLSVGAGHVTAIKTDGTLWVWGTGAFARLGINASGNRSTPVTTFAGGTNWKQSGGGGAHSAALTYDDPVI
jgi:alpha-tubulin suppressor-like RCC1 family protein